MHCFLVEAFLTATIIPHLGAAVDTSQPKVVSLPVSKRPIHKPGRSLSKRGAFPANLLNNLTAQAYHANVTIGTPPQNFTLHVDTGSSDIWVLGPEVCNTPSDSSFDPCLGEPYIITNSTTSTILSKDSFGMLYADLTNVKGDYITDVVRVGNAAVKNQTLGLARYSDGITNGIMGIGFASDEASAQASNESTKCIYYHMCPKGTNYMTPTFVDQLAEQGAIGSKTCSLWLNDLEASTGTIMFGGYDKARFKGELIAVPIVPNPIKHSTTFTIGLSSVHSTTQKGVSNSLSPHLFPAPALLDSGTSVTYLPEEVLAPLLEHFPIKTIPKVEAYFIECNTSVPDRTLDFGFGGPGGPIISVPFDEFLLPTGFSAEFMAKYDLPGCRFGLQPARQNHVVLGDSFLRSAYVVHDMGNKQIALAQARLNATGSDVREFPAGPRLHGVKSTATGATSFKTQTPKHTPVTPATVSIEAGVMRR